MIRMAIIAWPCIHYGGAERWWYYVLREFRRDTEISYYVVIPFSLHRGCLRCPKVLPSSNIIIIYLPPKRNQLLAFFSWLRDLIKLIKERNIDLIIAGYQTPRIVLLSLLTGVITKRRVFVMFHSPIGWLPYVGERRAARIPGKARGCRTRAYPRRSESRQPRRRRAYCLRPRRSSRRAEPWCLREPGGRSRRGQRRPLSRRRTPAASSYAPHPRGR